MKRHVRVIFAACAVVSMLMLAACGSYGSGGTGSTGGSGSGSTGGTASKSVTVSLKNFAFNPSDITVAAGGSVTFVNNDSTTHDVVGSNFDSGRLDPGKSFTQTFATAGTFPIHCSIHPSMTAQVTVK